MELLAPAGTQDTFLVAIEAGADAVYLGAPRLNARNLARDLSLPEIGAMVHYAHRRGKKVHIALNSLVRETDLPLLLETLCWLEEVGPDALIVQDLGLIRLARSFFPDLRLHGSTLLSSCNRQGLALLQRYGCARAVLARELTLKEIAALARDKQIELEIFIHGAMCFSYSGLCLFSSFFGGKSGLRGTCVQPCRRKFSVAGSQGGGKARSGYFFSMNDLEGLALVPELKRLGIDSLKIEGRLRSPTYVDRVVRAYRMVIDAPERDAEQAIREARQLIPEALGRKTSSGFLRSQQPKGAITPHHSGNMGSYLGRIQSLQDRPDGCYGRVAVKQPCRVGDRIRIHDERSGERVAFTLQAITAGPSRVAAAQPGQRVALLLPATLGPARGPTHFDVYRVDSGESAADLLPPDARELPRWEPATERQKQVKAKSQRLRRAIIPEGTGDRSRSNAAKPDRLFPAAKPELWVRTDTPQLLFQRLPFRPRRVLVNLQKKTVSFAGQLKGLRKGGGPEIIWALPPVVVPAGIDHLQRDIDILIRSGFRSFQIGHLSQMAFFAGHKVSLFGDYTLNLLNTQALDLVFSEGLLGAQLCIEMDRTCLHQTMAAWRQQVGSRQQRGGRKPLLGLTVYGAPPLFTSRLAADHFVYGRPLLSPKRESFVIEKQEGGTVTRPQRPFSLLPYQDELQQVGLAYLVIDLSGLKTG
ncbi:MAG: peptidase U32 family protein, partial [Desulfofustis sp.]|nr:peptidase U32 family protein [Desulfofustis sp.]